MRAEEWRNTPLTTELWQSISSGNVDDVLQKIAQEPKIARVRSEDGTRTLYLACSCVADLSMQVAALSFGRMVIIWTGCGCSERFLLTEFHRSALIDPLVKAGASEDSKDVHGSRAIDMDV
jgi:hypothetical protein